MTETSPVASVTDLPGDLADADEETQFDFVALQGIPLPFVEIRARDVDGNLIPWDGEAMGELEVPRAVGRVVATTTRPSRPTAGPRTAGSCTGDIVSIDERGFIAIKDRSKDVIKSGGEWISSVELECALMAHPAVAEAAVIAIPDEKWTNGRSPSSCSSRASKRRREELREFLSGSFAKWWLPDRFEFIDEIPKTAVGKFRKTALREQFVGAESATPAKAK